MTELKNCPFCANDVFITQGLTGYEDSLDASIRHFVCCEVCDLEYGNILSGEQDFDSDMKIAEELARTWNIRCD